MIDVRQNCQNPQSGDGLLEQFDSLSGDFERLKGDSRKVPTRPGQALRDSELDRVAADGKQNRHILNGLDRSDRESARDDEGDFRPYQAGHVARERLDIPRGVTQLEEYVLPFDVAAPTKPFAKSLKERIRLRFRRNPSDPVAYVPLLRLRQAR